MNVELTEAQGAKLAEIFFARSGILLNAGRRESLAVRVEARLAELGLADTESYLALIASGAKGEEEARRFVESMLIGETYFFRESAQLEALIRSAAPMLRNRLAAGRPTLSVWSAGCSIGCEPYTIAMLLTELYPAWNIRVLGTDLNREFLAVAAKGEFDARTTRYIPERFLTNPLYLKPVGDRYRVGEMLREIVSFEPLNLRSDRFPEDQDLILCRNVLIYFEDDMVETLVSGFHRSLAPGGHLCVGSADNLFRFDAFFTPLRVAEATIYRRWSADRRETADSVPPVKGENRRKRVEIPRVRAHREEGTHHVVIKNLGNLLKKVRFAAGSTILGDGRVVLILDVPEIVKSAGAESERSRPAASATSAGLGRKVLVVEDSNVVRRRIKEILEAEGHLVTEAADGKDGLTRARQETFDLVTVDIMMPRMDGYELTARLRTLPEYRTTPIVMISSRADEVDKKRGFEAGVDDYITKPFAQDRLAACVGKFLR